MQYTKEQVKSVEQKHSPYKGFIFYSNYSIPKIHIIPPVLSNLFISYMIVLLKGFILQLAK